MIAKERTVPQIILAEEAILRRINSNHPKKKVIEDDYGRRKAGHWGEEALDYYLNFLQDKDLYIFHGLRLFNGHTYFQMDTLIINGASVILIETKNISGTITFDDHFHQLIKYKNGEETGLPDPITQAEHQLLQFRKWLQTYGFPELPLEYFVVSSNPSCIIKTTANSSKIYHRVCRVEFILNKVQEVHRKFKAIKLDQKELKKLKNLLIKKHSPLLIDVLKLFAIPQKDITPGVQCPECLKLPMKYKRGKWYCLVCKHSSTDAHIQAIKDYFLLIKPSITNSELRYFLNLSSRSIALNILKKMNLPSIGLKKYQEYREPIS